MSRPLRLKLENQIAYYHIISRTVGKEFLLKEKEKQKLFTLIRHYSDIYFVEIISFTIMSNHFHLLIQLSPGNRYNDASLKKRIRKYVGPMKYSLNPPAGKEIKKYRKKFSDLSHYVRDIKQQFAYWYNQTYERFGYFWGDRFKSVIFEPGFNLLQCLTYIDLNAVTAGIVQKAEDYRWCSAYYRFKYRRKVKFLSFKGIFSRSLSAKTKLIEYYKYLKEKESAKTGISNKIYKFSEVRKSYYANGIAVGSRLFINIIVNNFAIKRKKPPVQLKTSDAEEAFALKECFT